MHMHIRITGSEILATDLYAVCLVFLGQDMVNLAPGGIMPLAMIRPPYLPIGIYYIIIIGGKYIEFTCSRKLFVTLWPLLDRFSCRLKGQGWSYRTSPQIGLSSVDQRWYKHVSDRPTIPAYHLVINFQRNLCTKNRAVSATIVENFIKYYQDQT